MNLNNIDVELGRFELGYSIKRTWLMKDNCVISIGITKLGID